MDKFSEFLDAVGWCWCVKRRPSIPGINKKVPIYWVMGPRYCGKTTLAEELSNQIKFNLISVPQANVNDVTPNETILDYILKQMNPYKHTAEGFIVDGFPTSLSQARHFFREIYEPRLIIYVTLTEELFLERIKYAKRNRQEEEKLLEEFRNSTVLLNKIYTKYETKTLKLLSNGPPQALAKNIVLYIDTYYGFD